MKTSSPNAAVEMNATVTKFKIEFKNEEVLKILRREYPETIPDEFVKTMIPAFMLGIEEGLRVMGYKAERKGQP